MKISNKNKTKLAFGLVLVSMIVIIILWFSFSPPQYFRSTDEPGIFDTLKSEFSNI